ncbi:PP2C family protein-serine/threonine phosphatase [Streptomyces sp. NPDC002547]
MPVLLPVVLITTITLSAMCAPLTVHLSPLLVAAPTCTAALARTRLTVTVAAAAGAAVFLVDRHDGLLYSSLLPIHVGSVLVVSGFVITIRALYDRDLRELEQVRAVAEAAQRVLLRPIPGKLGSLHVAALYRAAAAHARVGGDLYAAARSARTTRILIGDVRGNGLPAIEDAAAVLGAFREAAHEQDTIQELAASLERSIRRHLSELADTDPDSGERFVTALLIEFPDNSDLVRVVSCGHPSPLLLHQDQVSFLDVDQPAPPLGLAGDKPEAFPLRTFTFGPGDMLLLYTDGLAEARDATGDFYPVLDRAPTWAWDCPYGLLLHVSREIDRHTGQHLQDDLALVAIQHPTYPSHPQDTQLMKGM